MNAAAIVLLSGLDSTAALHLAMVRHPQVVALGFDYGQPSAELEVSQAIAERRGVQWRREAIQGIGERRPDAGRDDAGISRAFVPARNGILVWHAANVAARMFPGGAATIVVGCNSDDAAAFPDCRSAFIRLLSENVRDGLRGACDLRVEAPWVNRSKAWIVKWATHYTERAATALVDMREAVSCYRGTRCGECDACTLRARAFAEAGVEDA